MMTDRPRNGANVIVVAPGGENVLLVQHAYGEKYWALPGGAIDPADGSHKGETSVEAAKREALEEAGIKLSNLKLVAILSQRPQGLVTLYETRNFSGEIRTHPTEEILGVKFMSIQEIFLGKQHVGLAYRRMVAIWHKQLYKSSIYEGRLSEEVGVCLTNKVLLI